MNNFSRKTITIFIFSIILLISGNAFPNEVEYIRPKSLDFPLTEPLNLPKPDFVIIDSGADLIVDYSKYGEFQNVNSDKYLYKIKDFKGLQKAVGAGIYPYELGVIKEPGYDKKKSNGLLNIGHWDSLKLNDTQASFYIWAKSLESNGVKSFFTAQVLEKSGNIKHAIKAYYATLVHFPKAYCWGRDLDFVWYIAPVAIDNIKRLCRDYPSLGIELVDEFIDIKNGNDTDSTNDIITVNPGRLIEFNGNKPRANLSELSIKETRGTGEVQLVKFSNGDWQIQIGGKPYFIQGVTYNPTRIGLGPHNNSKFFSNWMFSDVNNNSIVDAPYESWVDSNKNGKQDENEPAIGDFQLLRDMGVNTIRFVIPNDQQNKYDPSLINKKLLRDMYNNYGIRIVMTDYLGAYTLGSNADWATGTDYRSEEQRIKMKEVVRQKVTDLKDEPFILMWVLGNENNLTIDYNGINASRTNAANYPIEYAKFVNEVAEMIHEIDGNHPVAIGNMGTGLMEYYNEYAPAIDIFGINSYPGKEGFGDMWNTVKRTYDRPILLIEYGCDAYDQDFGVNEEAQYVYHKGNIRDIIFNQAGGSFAGNAIGGIIFEYLDEWWKDTSGNPEDVHQIYPQFPMSFPDGYSHEEWLGIVGQGSGKNSPFERRLRKTYYLYKNIWGY